MSTRRKFFMIFCFIVLDAFLLIGFLAIRDATSINQLKKEVNELTKLSIVNDRYNRSIKTKGGYAIVETSIKEYLDNYAVSVQEVSDLIHDPKLAKILSYDNYLEDGPDFQNSIAYLNESKKTFNDEIDQLLVDLEEEQIMENIVSLQKVIVPMNELYKQANKKAGITESDEAIFTLQSDLNNLQEKVLVQNTKNRELLRSQLGRIRQQLNSLKNPYAYSHSVYAQKQAVASLVEIQA